MRTLLGIWLGLTLAATAAEIRYQAVAYLDDLKLPPVELKVLRRTPISASRDLQSFLWRLAPGQKVTLLGVGEGVYYVAARVATGPVQGWVETAAVEAPPASLIDEVQRRRERLRRNRELIERREVGLEMTRPEVLASLGKPHQRQRLQTADGVVEQWIYITYRYLPQYLQTYDAAGQYRQTVTYQRVPAGQRVITFRDEWVVAIADDVVERPLREGIVVPPAEAGP
jgi:hypothetical protein